VVLSKEDGIVYKRVFRKKGNEYELYSDNPVYQPYQFHANEILETRLQHRHHRIRTENLDYIDIKEMLQRLRMDVSGTSN
jgi:hypothetical protein